MEIELYRRQRDQGKVAVVLVVFKRIVALCLIVFALGYWARITGIWPGDGLAFDTMPEHWRFAAPVLAVMLPVSAIGLWGQFSWGTISWLLTAATELAIFNLFGERFGAAPFVTGFHAVTIAAYFALKGASRAIGGAARLLPVRKP